MDRMRPPTPGSASADSDYFSESDNNSQPSSPNGIKPVTVGNKVSNQTPDSKQTGPANKPLDQMSVANLAEPDDEAMDVDYAAKGPQAAESATRFSNTEALDLLNATLTVRKLKKHISADLAGIFNEVLTGKYRDSLVSMLERNTDAIDDIVNWFQGEWAFFEDRVQEADQYLNDNIATIDPSEAGRLDRFKKNLGRNLNDIIKTELENNLRLYNASSSDYSVAIREITANQILGEVPWADIKEYQNDFVETYLDNLNNLRAQASGFQATRNDEADADKTPSEQEIMTRDRERMLKQKTNPYIGNLMYQFGNN